MLYYDDYFICFNAGWGTQSISAQLQLSMSFKDCYKNVINTLFNWSNWVGPTALWIDNCDNSNEQALTFIQRNLVPSTYTLNDNFFFGGGIKTDPTVSSNCFPGQFLSENSLVGTVVNYYVRKYIAAKVAS